METQLLLNDGDQGPVGPALSAPIIERSPLPILEVFGPSHTISHVNSAFCRLIGKSKAELLGRLFSDIVPKGESCLDVLNHVYKTGEGTIHTVEDDSDEDPSCWLYAMWPALGKDELPVGAIIQLTKTSKRLRDLAAVNEALLISGLRQHEHIEETDRLNGQLHTEIAMRQKAHEDLGLAIAELNVAKSAAERDSRAKDEFLAALSHELRTPLTPVLLAVAGLREDTTLALETREQLAMMERNIELEARLIDDLLDVTKIVHGKLQLRPQLCDAHYLIRMAASMVRGDALAKEILIESNLNAKKYMLSADPTRFQQVIWNLIRNAVKFTPVGGKVSITTSSRTDDRGKGLLRIEVTDSGIGIDPGQIENIFEPFDQGGLSAAHHFGGVGLGLAIARAVIKMHGGQIGAESRGAGFGATFAVELPGATEPKEDLAESLPLASRSPTRQAGARQILPVRLLLVEDHENSLKTLTALLTRDGHHVTAVGTVHAALAAAAAKPFDLVISDIGLPDGSGIELMGKLRDGYALRGIALTGYGADEDLARSHEAGFVAHLVKPVSAADLRRTLSSVTEQKS